VSAFSPLALSIVLSSGLFVFLCVRFFFAVLGPPGPLILRFRPSFPLLRLRWGLSDSLSLHPFDPVVSTWSPSVESPLALSIVLSCGHFPPFFLFIFPRPLFPRLVLVLSVVFRLFSSLSSSAFSRPSSWFVCSPLSLFPTLSSSCFGLSGFFLLQRFVNPCCFWYGLAEPHRLLLAIPYLSRKGAIQSGSLCPRSSPAGQFVLSRRSSIYKANPVSLWRAGNCGGPLASDRQG
jgi:hypothetical protein